MKIERGQIYWHDLGPARNHVQAGLRPVLVVQTNDLNRVASYSNVVIVPITTKPKNSPTYVALQPGAGNKLTEVSYAITNQILTVDQDELTDFSGDATLQEMYLVSQGLRITLDL